MKTFGQKISLLAAALALLPAACWAEGAREELQNYLQLAAKDPGAFGFADESDAQSAKLGRCYAYYSLPQWREYVAGNKGSVSAAPELAPEKVCEVTNAQGEPRCAFFFARTGDRQFRPVRFGDDYFSEIFKALRKLPQQQEWVLLVDLDTKEFHCASAQHPEEIERLSWQANRP